LPDVPLPFYTYSENINFERKKEFPMDAHTSLAPMIRFVFKEDLPAQPIQACSRDYGFDFDEEEIGREMLAFIPANLSSQTIPDIDVDEYEQVFPCFLS
jgi:hypothetical protein